MVAFANQKLKEQVMFHGPKGIIEEPKMEDKDKDNTRTRRHQRKIKKTTEKKKEDIEEEE